MSTPPKSRGWPKKPRKRAYRRYPTEVLLARREKRRQAFAAEARARYLEWRDRADPTTLALHDAMWGMGRRLSIDLFGDGSGPSPLDPHKEDRTDE